MLACHSGILNSAPKIVFCVEACTQHSSWDALRLLHGQAAMVSKYKVEGRGKSNDMTWLN